MKKKLETQQKTAKAGRDKTLIDALVKGMKSRIQALVKNSSISLLSRIRVELDIRVSDWKDCSMDSALVLKKLQVCIQNFKFD